MQTLADPAMRLADRWQRGFPPVRQPFAEIAAAEDLTEAEVIGMLRALVDAGQLGRIGATVRPNAVGASTLAAMAVPADRLEDVATTVSAEPYVNHNYERDNALNLWFVVTAPDPRSLADTLARIEGRTGCRVLNLPLERSYHIDLGFPLVDGARPAPRGTGRDPRYRPDDADRALLRAIEDGLPLVGRPYRAVADAAGMGEAEVIARLERLCAAGIVTRFGCILRHRALGYTANAMVVWDVPDREVDDLGTRLAGFRDVTLCYRRTRRPPDWPFNLYCMVHGRERDAVAEIIGELARSAGLDRFASATLFSTRCFKQRGARFSVRRLEGAA